MTWNLWIQGPVLLKLAGVRPLLASWNSNSDPAYIRLQKYLDIVESALSPLPNAKNLYLHINYDVKDPPPFRGDLENLLTPLFLGSRLPSSRFVVVSARKRVGGGHEIICGEALPSLEVGINWQHFSMNAGSGLKKQKERMYNGLAVSKLPVVPPGPATVRLAWRCSTATRNWANLWKSTGDAMGPVLGSNSRNHFNPNDDRITELEMHLNADETIGHDVIVGMWWRSA